MLEKKIRHIFEEFNNNCGKSIISDELLSIDKTLYPMKNKVVFKQFNLISLLSIAYYSKALVHHVILIHLFQRRTAEILLENKLKNKNLVPLK